MNPEPRTPPPPPLPLPRGIPDPAPVLYVLSPAVVFSAFVLLFGIALQALNRAREVDAWPAVVAEVIAVRSEPGALGMGGDSYFHTFKYTFEGLTTEVIQGGRRIPGDRFVIRIDPRNPRRWALYRSGPAWLWPALACALLASLMIVTFAALLARYRDYRAAAWLLAHGRAVRVTVIEALTCSWRGAVPLHPHDRTEWRGRFQVIAQWRESDQSEERFFISYRLTTDPRALVGREITALIDPEEPDQYYLGEEQVRRALEEEGAPTDGEQIKQ